MRWAPVGRDDDVADGLVSQQDGTHALQEFVLARDDGYSSALQQAGASH